MCANIVQYVFRCLVTYDSTRQSPGNEPQIYSSLGNLTGNHKLDNQLQSLIVMYLNPGSELYWYDHVPDQVPFI